MKKFKYEKAGKVFVVTQWGKQLFDVKAYEGDVEVWIAPNTIYNLRDCSTHVRMYLKAKGLRIKWQEIVLDEKVEGETEMNINDYLSEQTESYLKLCFDELEAFRKDGVLAEGEIRKLNKTFFNNNTTTLFTIGENIYREIARIHFGERTASEKVRVTCYGVTNEFDSFEEAKEEYLDCIANAEGSERERYMNVYLQLQQGLKDCRDDA